MATRKTLGALIGAMLLLGACADDGTTDSASTTTTTEDREERSVDDEVVERVADAAAKTVDEGTARFTVAVASEGTGTGADDEQPITVDGEVDFENEQRLLTLQGPSGELDVVIDADVAYVELPATEGDDWMKVELDSLFDDDIGFGGPAAMPFQSPEDNLRVLEGSAVHAAEAGEETIDGEDTTRYEMIIDLEAAAEDANNEVEEAVRTTSERTGLSELEIDVWVDEDDLIRRVEYTLDLSEVDVEEDVDSGSVEADTQGSVTVTVDYSDFGTNVNIEVPDDEDVVDIDEDAVRDAIGGSQGGSAGTTSTTSGSGGDDSTTTSSANDTTTTTEDE